MTCLVFGGRSPISLALCARLAEQAKEVHLVTRTIDDEMRRLGEMHGVTQLHECDLVDEPSALELVKELDERAPGLQEVAFVHRYRGPADVFAQYQVEVVTPFRVVEALHQRPRPGGCAVVLTTSPAARNVLLDQDFHYHASKAALAALVRFAAVRYADNNLRVNGVSPGTFVFKERAATFYAENPEILQLVERDVPLSRMATVQEVANIMSFLLSDASGYVNGQIIEVDGGIAQIDGASLARKSIPK